MENKTLPTSLSPWLNVRGSREALEFYKKAFDASELFVLDPGEGGIVARLSINGAEFWLSDESPEHGNFSPQTINGCSVRLILVVPDPDATQAQAISAGAKELCPISEDHGWRVGRVEDPYGHIWEIAKKL